MKFTTNSNQYRASVGIIICNFDNQVLWAKRKNQSAWQFPQGGIRSQESPEMAMYRELFEETGLCKNDISILSKSRFWLSYTLPKNLQSHYNQENTTFVGQRQKWFLLRLINNDAKINLKIMKNKSEFDKWYWVDYWYPIKYIVQFKKQVYQQVMLEFSKILNK